MAAKVVMQRKKRLTNWNNYITTDVAKLCYKERRKTNEKILCHVCKRVSCSFHSFNVLLLEEGVDSLRKAKTSQHWTPKMPGCGQTFLISGIFGANLCEICEMTSWIKGWFFIVFRAFIILKSHEWTVKRRWSDLHTERWSPVSRIFCLRQRSWERPSTPFSFQLLLANWDSPWSSSTWNLRNAKNAKDKTWKSCHMASRIDPPGFKSYWSVSSLMRILAFTNIANTWPR